MRDLIIYRINKKAPGPISEFQCCVQACPCSGPVQKNPPLYFFKFPGNHALKNAWIEFSRINPKSVTASSRICSKHFENDQFEKTSPRSKIFMSKITTRVSEVNRFVFS